MAYRGLMCWGRLGSRKLRGVIASGNRIRSQRERPLKSVLDFSQKGLSTAAQANVLRPATDKIVPQVQSALPHGPHATKIIFSNNRVYDFKYIWLRDNCNCHACLHPDTKQKLLDTTILDVLIKPKSIEITEDGHLTITWPDSAVPDSTSSAMVHQSIYTSKWLYKWGESFATEDPQSNAEDLMVPRPALTLWDRTEIWKNFPEISHRELMESDEGLMAWLGMIHKYGIAVIRGVPLDKDEVVKVVRRFAYIKETSYGVTFDVISEPTPDHLAFSGRRLELHTDMNYREKSPGLQLLHCVRAHDVNSGTQDGTVGGKSFFADGFHVAKWLQTNHPSSFHVLTTTPVKFSITTNKLHYSQHWPIICTNHDGDITEIHHNNRTMAPLQAPSHIIMAFYHAYKRFTEKSRDPTMTLNIRLAPGDVIAFNNRRVMHGRTEFDPTKVIRHLIGCYVDIDEAMTKYDQLINIHKV